MGDKISKQPEEIGSGIYGVVYRPPWEVKEDELNRDYGNSDYVMKVYHRVKPKLNETLKRVDPEQKYFIFPIALGTLKEMPTELKSKDKPFQRASFMRYGGKDINKYRETHKVTCKRLLKFSHNLILGLAILHIQAKMIHRDIVERNILIHKGIARFCDIEPGDVPINNESMNNDIRMLIDMLFRLGRFVSRKSKYWMALDYLLSLLHLVFCMINRDEKCNSYKLHLIMLRGLTTVRLFM